MINGNSQGEYQATTAKLNDMIAQTGPRLHHHLLLVTTIFIFPPVAIYLMWKYKEYHMWFATLSWVSGAFLLVYTYVINFFLLPWIQGYLNGNRVDVKVTLSGLVISVLVFFALIQTGLGFYLRHQYKLKGDLTRAEMSLAIGLYLLGYLLPGFLYGDIVGPIYSGINLEI